MRRNCNEKKVSVKRFFLSFIILILIVVTISSAIAKVSTIKFIEHPSNPIFDPSAKAYYPSILYDANGFNGHGDIAYYKMWFGSNSGVGYAYSNNGKNWKEGTNPVSNLTNANHPLVEYYEDGFSCGEMMCYYRMWYWDQSQLYSMSAIRYAESSNGIDWFNDQASTGNIISGVAGEWNRGSYGAIDVFYSPTATNSGTNPFDYSFVMYFDATTGGFEEIGLGYSSDGKNWQLYGKVLPRGNSGTWGNTDNWDSSYTTFGTVVKESDEKWHMWYSGGQRASNEGIGHATSSDGINWVRDENNPIFHKNDSISWRNDRVYTPQVIYDSNKFSDHGNSLEYKMWFSGKDTVTGNYAIGYAYDAPTTSEMWVDDDYNEILCSAAGHVWQYNCFDTIQEGIAAVAEGGTVNVAAGTYEEEITINKSSLTLRGATYNTNKNGYPVPENYTWNDSVESIIQPPSSSPDVDVITIDDSDDVTVEGFVIQALNRGASGTRMLVTVKVDDKTMENLVIRNNILGANTNVENQDGNKGRMNLYFDINPYDESQGLINSLVSGNKIFDAKGNGNNIFIWASYYAYGATGPSPMEGTIIEDNEIYGSHRTGIETAGGYSDLVIRNNKIYGNSGLPTDNSSNLKYGHGILLIRGSSDKTAGPTEAYGPKDLTIQDNEIYDNEKSGIYMGPINKDYTITGNDIHDNGWDGIRLDMDGTYWNPTFEPAPSDWSCYNGTEDILANNNKIYNNEQKGVNVIGTATNGFEFDAENNYWGTTDGPSGEGSGTGDAVSENIDYKPWYVDSNMTMLLDKDLNENQTLAYEADLTLEGNTTEIVVLVGSPIQNISIHSAVAEDKEISLDLSLLLNPNKGVSLTKKLKLKRNGAKADYISDIPEGTIITGDSDWDGSVILPTVKNNTGYTAPSGSVDIVIDIGSESELNFSKAVKIVIGGKAGKKAAWSRGTVLTEITTVCNNVNDPTNIYPVNAPRECYIDDGSDLLIWTYHFTKFVVYTPASTTTTTTGGGSGGRKLVSIEPSEPIGEEKEKEEEEKEEEEEEKEEEGSLILGETTVTEKAEPKMTGRKLLVISIALFLAIMLFIVKSQSRIHRKTYRKLRKKIKRIFP